MGFLIVDKWVGIVDKLILGCGKLGLGLVLLGFFDGGGEWGVEVEFQVSV